MQFFRGAIIFQIALLLDNISKFNSFYLHFNCIDYKTWLCYNQKLHIVALGLVFDIIRMLFLIVI